MNDFSASIAAFSDTTLSDAANALTPDLLATVVRKAVASDHVLARTIHGAVLSVAYENNEISINKRDVVSDPSKATKGTAKPGAGATRSDMAPVAKQKRQPRKAAAVATAKSIAGERAPKVSKTQGVKRDPSVLAAIVDKVEAHIKANPGQGTEEIGRALNMKTKDLQLPMRKLGETNKITSKGQKRATRYFPS